MPFLTFDTSVMVPKKHWFSKQWYKLREVLVYQDNSGGIWSVAAGFIHDYASIPRIFWPILTPTGPYSRAAILHDSTHNDKLFLEAMIADGTPEWLAKVMYAAVARGKIDDFEQTSPLGD